MHQSCKLLFFTQTLTFGKRTQCFLFHTHLQLSPPILCSRFKFPVIVCEYILRAVSGRADYTLTSHLYNLGHLNNYNAKSWPILSQRQLSSPYKIIYQMFTRKKMAGLYCGRFERRGQKALRSDFLPWWKSIHWVVWSSWLGWVVDLSKSSWFTFIFKLLWNSWLLQAMQVDWE